MNRQLETVQGRLAFAKAKSNNTTSEILINFIYEEISYRCEGCCYPTCIIYMPDIYVSNKYGATKKNSHILIEVHDSDPCFFEIKTAKATSFDDVICEPVFNSYRYYGMTLAHNEVVGVSKEVLFSPLFRQRFLMTIESRALGSMNTRKVLSPVGNLYSFRACVLKE